MSGKEVVNVDRIVSVSGLEKLAVSLWNMVMAASLVIVRHKPFSCRFTSTRNVIFCNL